MAEVMENCLTYALRTWRMGRPSDHLVIRRSHWGWFPHFAVVFEMENGDLEKREYVPIKPRPRWLPLLFFKGVEKITYYRRSYVIDGRTNH
jgi:hypothetical protein